MKLSVLFALIPAILAAPAIETRDGPAPLLTPRDVDVVADRYIVKFKDSMTKTGVDETMNKLHSKVLKTKAQFVYKNAFHGFAGRLSKDELKTLRDRTDVSVFRCCGNPSFFLKKK